MKVLVTGGAGYIGSHVVQALGKDGHDIIIYDNLSTGRQEAVLHGVLVYGDLNDESALNTLFYNHDFDAVMHFAASTVVDVSVRNPLDYYQNNVSNTINLLQQCKKHKVEKFIFSSTAAVYGMGGSKPRSETDATQPMSPYGWSKLMAEQIISDYAENHTIQYAIFRYYNVAGSDSKLKIGCGTATTHLIQTACRAAVGKIKELVIFGTDYNTPDGTCIRDYIHITDLAQAHIKVLNYLKTDGRNLLLNCGYGRGFSVREIINYVKESSGVDFSVREGQRRAGDPPIIIANTDKLYKELGWNPEFDDIATITNSAWQWEQKLQQSGEVLAEMM